jgi:hypothetical protein
VYAVLALRQSFEEVLTYHNLPYYVKAVLLPFKGKIVYDDMLQPYSVSFGGGVKSNLKEVYLTAKQNRRIIDSFDSQEQQADDALDYEQLVEELAPVIAEILQQAQKLRASRGAPAIHGPAFSLVKAGAEFAQLAVEDPDDVGACWKALKKVQRAINKAETALRRSGFY